MARGDERIGRPRGQCNPWLFPGATTSACNIKLIRNWASKRTHFALGASLCEPVPAETLARSVPQDKAF